MRALHALLVQARVFNRYGSVRGQVLQQFQIVLGEGAVGELIVDAEHADDLSFDGQRHVEQRLDQVFRLDLLRPLIAYQHRTPGAIDLPRQRVLRLDAEIARGFGIQPLAARMSRALPSSSGSNSNPSSAWLRLTAASTT
ncbi:MAG: hypothetical protein KatS3mg051_0856 [Anaerolineae bacterium]|nr:MAG: hypothetical protein KatS3mg051_0856 [Anaerolineae bacterium]